MAANLHCLSYFHHLNPQTPTTTITISCCVSLHLTPKCALTKQGQRFLTSLTMSPPSYRVINKFVTSSPKSVTLSTLNHLLSPNTTHPHLSSLAFPLYMKVTEVSWFSWNAKLAASVIALLYRLGRVEEAEGQILEIVSKMCTKERDLVSFYCSLIDYVAKGKSEIGFAGSCARLKGLLCKSSSAYVRKRAYESLVGGLCVMGLPHDAKDLIDEMRLLGIKPSLFEFRSLVEGYGKLGLFEEMQQSVYEMGKCGFALDTISLNMILSSYGSHNELSEMVIWLQKAKTLGIGFSVRTYNSVLNACPTLMSLLQNLKDIPVSLDDLVKVLHDDEALLVEELIGAPVLNELITWNSLESKLDLHGMHLGTSYLIMLQWIKELRFRFTSGCYEVPAEITVVCGLGKHSSIRGDSPVKAMVREIVLRTRSPLRIDRKNIGCFIGKGRALVDWLS